METRFLLNSIDEVSRDNIEVGKKYRIEVEEGTELKDILTNVEYRAIIEGYTANGITYYYIEITGIKIVRMNSNVTLKKKIAKEIKYLDDYEIYLEIFTYQNFEGDFDTELSIIIHNKDYGIYKNEFTNFGIIEGILCCKYTEKQLMKEAKKCLKYFSKHFNIENIKVVSQ